MLTWDHRWFAVSLWEVTEITHGKKASAWHCWDIQASLIHMVLVVLT